MALESTLYTALGWAVMIGAGGALYFYYKGNDTSKRSFTAKGNRSRQQKQLVPETKEARPARAQKQSSKKNAVASKQTGASSKADTLPADTTPTNVTSSARSATREKDTNDADFARQLAQKQKGATFKSADNNSSRQKTVKQSSANKRAEMSASSSTVADAEDESSSLPSPTQSTTTQLPSGRDVSDMLEPAGPAPTVLRLTEPTEPAPTRKPREHKAVQEEESKKQRQNRKKREEAQRVREEQEAERRVLLEQQRRTARVARGEPAKNGIPIPAAPPSGSAWSRGTHSNPGSAGPMSESVPLLDTFSADNASTSTSSSLAAPETPATAGSVNGVEGVPYQLPDEDEQMRRLIEQDDTAWTSVPSKGRKKAEPLQTPQATGLTGKSSASSVLTHESALHRLGNDVEA